MLPDQAWWCTSRFILVATPSTHRVHTQRTSTLTLWTSSACGSSGLYLRTHNLPVSCTSTGDEIHLHDSVTDISQALQLELEASGIENLPSSRSVCSGHDTLERTSHHAKNRGQRPIGWERARVQPQAGSGATIARL